MENQSCKTPGVENLIHWTRATKLHYERQTQKGLLTHSYQSLSYKYKNGSFVGSEQRRLCVLFQIIPEDRINRILYYMVGSGIQSERY